jgi:hypothetical protein
MQEWLGSDPQIKKIQVLAAKADRIKICAIKR